jgi:uncharacterized phiE125 gp8 family phage protein
MIDKVKTPATGLVVSLPEFKKHLKWDPSDTSEDTIMELYIKAATGQCEAFCSRSFLSTVWYAFFDIFPYCPRLTYGPVDPSNVVVKYYDESNVEQTLATTEYKIKDGGDFGRTAIEFDGTIPAIYDRPNAVTVEYTVGYTTIPSEIKAAVLIQAATLFEFRTDQQAGSIVNPLHYGSRTLLYPFRLLSC